MNERTIYLAALDITDPAECSAYLDRACAGNAKLRQQVDALLAADARSGEFLDVPALRQMADNPDMTQTFGEKADDEQEFDLSYLTPSTKPGSLGTLGHYEVMQVLGQGGFGTVLKAFDEKLHRMVAIKVLSRQLAATSPPRKRFLREARAVAAIKHENVVQVYSVEEQPLPYIVMEFVNGSTLQDKMDEAGPLGVTEVLHLGRQIAAGLAAAHSLGLIHRDIKPANILLEQGVVQKVKITDFGLARTADDASLSQSGTIAGTPLYMAPEQAKGAKLDSRADLFSLGSVLYALACGHPPFRAPTTIAVLRRVAEDTPRPLQDIIPEVPDWFVAIIDKLLAKEPADRFQTAQEVADLLTLCQSKLHAGVSPSAVELGLKVAPVEPVAKVEPKRNKFPVAGVGAGIALMVAVMVPLLFLFNKNKHDDTVAVQPPETPAVPVPATTDPDRKAAEYILSIGGEVMVNEVNQGIKNVADLPKNPFRLNYVSSDNSNKITDESLAVFKDCKNLSQVSLDQSIQVTDTGLSYFNNCTLFCLCLSSSKISDAGITRLKNTSDLGILHVGGTKISDDGLSHFKDCTKIIRLNIGYTSVGDNGLKNFENCKSLEDLNIANTRVTDAGLDFLKDCKNLTFLCILKTKVTRAKFEELKKTFPNCKIESDYGTYDPAASIFKNSLGMEFVKVPKGTGWLGGGAGKQGETKVVIEQDFYLGKYEVTQEEWETVMGTNPSQFSRNGAMNAAVKGIPDADLKRFPVEMVSWDDCQLFIKKLNEKEKEKGWVYRLPKEAEWEYACRGGPVDKVDSAFDFYLAKPTNTLLPGQANIGQPGKGLQRTCKVGSYEANLLGLHDMHGNAWEWCDDTETAANGAARCVRRGGNWGNASGLSQAAVRNTPPPTGRYNGLGLRLARVPVGPAVAVPAPTDREVAEWVLSVGGKIFKAHDPDKSDALEEVKLPVSGPVVFDAIRLDNVPITDDELDNLKGLKQLAFFAISGNKGNVTDKGIAKLAAMPWAGSLKSITIVHGTPSKLTDEAFAHIAKFPKLWWANLTCDPKTTGRGLANLKGMGITWLGLNCFDLEPASARHLLDLPKLDALSLTQVTITDDLAAMIGTLIGLKYLNLAAYDKPGITDLGLKKLVELKNLERLSINKSRTTNDGLASLQQLPKLKTLEFNICNTIDDASLKILSQLKTVESLQMPDCPITDEGLKILATAKHLKSVWVQGKVTAQGVQDFRKTRPDCFISSDHGNFEPTAADPDRKATFKNSIGMEFVKVPKGTGWLGGGAGKQGETKVVIEQDFYLGKYEVTQEEWEKLTGVNPSLHSRKGLDKDSVKDISDADLKRFPVEMVTWDECQLFIKRLNEKEKDKGWVYRLPTEQEWEYACRGGPVDQLKSAFHFYLSQPTNTLTGGDANVETGNGKALKRPCKVGSYEPNSLGLYDMHGNLWEWCQDSVERSAGPTLRVLRGGNWHLEPLKASASYRDFIPSKSQADNVGLRLARVPVGPAKDSATSEPKR